MNGQGYSGNEPLSQRRGAAPVWYVVMGVLVLALVGVVVWTITSQDVGEPNAPTSTVQSPPPSDDPESPPPSDDPESPPPSDDPESPDPSDDPSDPPSPDPSEDASDERVGRLDAFPPTVGEWTFVPDPSRPFYRHTDGRTIPVRIEAGDVDYIEEGRETFRTSPDAVEFAEFDGGFCTAIEHDMSGTTVRTIGCSVMPARHQGQYYMLAATEPEVTTVAEMQTVGEAIVAYEG